MGPLGPKGPEGPHGPKGDAGTCSSQVITQSIWVFFALGLALLASLNLYLVISDQWFVRVHAR